MRIWLSLVMLFSLSVGVTVHANAVDDLLSQKTWCFADRSGPWDHGRLKFGEKSWWLSPVFYDVTDAPGGGGVNLEWHTYHAPTGLTVVLTRGKFPTWTRTSAHVDILSSNEMLWTWWQTGRPQSHLYPCN